MNERGGVDEFDHGSEPNRSRPLKTTQFGGEQHQGGTQSFAPAASQVLADLGDGLNAGDALKAKLLFHLLEVSTHQVEDFFDGQAIDRGQVPIPRRPFGFETPTQVLEGTGGSRCEPKYSHNSHLKESLNFATVRCKGSTLEVVGDDGSLSFLTATTKSSS
jgi:hypothetical protein